MDDKPEMTREQIIAIRARAMLTDDGDLMDLGNFALWQAVEIERLRGLLKDIYWMVDQHGSATLLSKLVNIAGGTP